MEILRSREAVQVYTPALEVGRGFIVSVLVSLPDIITSDAVNPGPFHKNCGVSVDPGARSTEHVRVTVFPTTIGDGGDEVKEILLATVIKHNEWSIIMLLHKLICPHQVCPFVYKSTLTINTITTNFFTIANLF